MDGLNKRKILVTGKTKNPRCLKSIELRYGNNKTHKREIQNEESATFVEPCLLQI